MTNRYAADTEVPSDRSLAEIRRLLMRYGADQFFMAEEAGWAHLGFRMQKRLVRIRVPMPSHDDRAFTLTPSGKWKREPDQALAAWEQAVRQRWRAMALLIKAQLEAIAAGISTFDETFLASLVLPDNHTVGEWAGPQIQRAYLTATMPPLLPTPAETRP